MNQSLKGWGFVAVAAVSTFIAYAFIAFSFLTQGLLFPFALVLAAASLVFLMTLIWAGKLSDTSLKHIGLLFLSMTISLLALDTGYQIYSSKRMDDLYDDIQFDLRHDESLVTRDLFPARYYPTQSNFTIYKPNQKTEGIFYGQFYYSQLKKEVAKNAGNVFQKRRISYWIDENGFRETTSIDKTEVFALGDSFTEGYGIDQDKTWAKLLEAKTGTPVYSLGIGGSSPLQELNILHYALGRKKVGKISKVIWMIFEGNDLEDDYHTQITGEDRKSLLKRTVFFQFARMLRDQSVINKIWLGQIAAPLQTQKESGKERLFSLFRSSQLGYRIFDPVFLKTVNQPKEYVLKHPNRAALDEVFRKMKILSRQNGFSVTVAIAPTAERLYAPYFENFPPVSPEPYFIQYVEHLSVEYGFSVINLYDALRPYATRELLYYRDDTHWNERGHQIVADLILKHLDGL